MRRSTLDRRIKESRRLWAWIVFWTAVGTGSIFALVRWYAMTDRYDYTSYGIFWTALITSLVAIALAMVMIANLNTGERPPPPPDDTPDSSDMLSFSNLHQAPQVSLHYAEDTTIRIAKQKLTRRQWLTLAETLSELNWRWTRANVRKANVIKNITAPGVYRELTTDLENIGVVDKGRVTIAGRDAICEAAGLEVVI